MLNGHAISSLDMKGCICHCAKWQIHPFISKRTRFRTHPVATCVRPEEGGLRQGGGLGCGWILILGTLGEVRLGGGGPEHGGGEAAAVRADVMHVT